MPLGLLLVVALAWPIPLVPPLARTQKACTRCGEVKLLDAFNRAKWHRDGRASECRDCAQVRNRLYVARSEGLRETRR